MKLASIFTNHMVLQANRPIKVFGQGQGTIVINFLGETIEYTSTKEDWCITLSERPYGGPYEMRIRLNEKEMTLNDIYVGEVWLACGQSNMEMPLFRTEHGFDDAEHAYNDKIRLFTVPKREERNTPCYGHHFEKTRGDDTPWQICTTDAALHFSAIGYYVAKELQDNLNVTIGIISCNWGGTLIEAYIKREYFNGHPALQYVWDDYGTFWEGIEEEVYLQNFHEHLQNWKTYYDSITTDEMEEARKKGVRATAGIRGTDLEEPFLSACPYYRNWAGCLYDSMIARIIPFGVKGVLWYQGESNGYETDYLEKYLLFMKCMRESFENPNMPFYAIELASFGCWNPNRPYQDDRFVTEDSWAFLREQQQAATEIGANNFLVTSMELGNFVDIHPIQKKLLSHRMALKILKHSYDFAVDAEQPTFRFAEFKDGKAYITLNNAEGLYAPGLDGLGTIKIYLADETHCLKQADIEIVNDTLILSSKEVPHPILARYAFDDFYGDCHIYNKAGLPLSPFRTDK